MSDESTTGGLRREITKDELKVLYNKGKPLCEGLMSDDPDANYVTRRARGSLPCPFCGNKKLEMEVDSWNQHTKYAHVRCSECSAHGPDADEDKVYPSGIIKEATARWNKRL